MPDIIALTTDDVLGESSDEVDLLSAFERVIGRARCIVAGYE
jgi:hypothetical protein